MNAPNNGTKPIGTPKTPSQTKRLNLRARSKQYALALVIVALSGCAVRARIQPWRLVNKETGQVLIPPDVTALDLTERTFRTNIVAGYGSCASTDGVITLKIHGKHAYLTVARDRLAAQASGWLEAWATQLEEQHCLAAGEGMRLAVRVVESVPLDLNTAFDLLYSNELQSSERDLGTYSRLRVVSPLWRKPGVGLMAEGPYTISGEDYTLTVTGKSTDNLTGYETTTYAVQPKTMQAGYTITPIYTDRHIEGKTERRPQPAVNYLRLPASAGFYRLFYKSWKNDFTAILVGARTPAELDERIKILQATGASASCETLHNDMCVVIPKDVGVVSLVSVTVNGTDMSVRRGTTVFDAINEGGEPVPSSVLPTLAVYKPWNGLSMPVAFDHAGDGILRLPLEGGEAISWH